MPALFTSTSSLRFCAATAAMSRAGVPGAVISSATNTAPNSAASALARRRVAPGEDEFRAAFGEQPRRRGTDAGGGPGDQGGFARLTSSRLLMVLALADSEGSFDNRHNRAKAFGP